MHIAFQASRAHLLRGLLLCTLASTQGLGAPGDEALSQSNKLTHLLQSVLARGPLAGHERRLGRVHPPPLMLVQCSLPSSVPLHLPPLRHHLSRPRCMLRPSALPEPGCSARSGAMRAAPQDFSSQAARHCPPPPAPARRRPVRRVGRGAGGARAEAAGRRAGPGAGGAVVVVKKNFFWALRSRGEPRKRRLEKEKEKEQEKDKDKGGITLESRERESLHLSSHTGLMQGLPGHPLADTITKLRAEYRVDSTHLR